MLHFEGRVNFLFQFTIIFFFWHPPSLVPYLACIFASCYSHFIDFFSAFQYLYPGGIMHLLLFLVWNFFFSYWASLNSAASGRTSPTHLSRLSWFYKHFLQYRQSYCDPTSETELGVFVSPCSWLWTFFLVVCDIFSLIEVFFFFFFSISTIASNLDMVTVYLEGFFFLLLTPFSSHLLNIWEINHMVVCVEILANHNFIDSRFQVLYL